MAYMDFTFADLRENFGLTYNTQSFFADVPPVPPSEFLLQQLELAKHFPMLSEKWPCRVDIG